MNRRDLYVSGGPLVYETDDPPTLQHALVRAASDAPLRGTTYVAGTEGDERQTYPELLREAQRVLGGLRALGLRAGEPVLLHCERNRHFVTGFWACVLGGFVATPVGAARGYDRDSGGTRKLRRAWELLGRPVLVSDAALRPSVLRLRELWSEPGLHVEAMEELAQVPADERRHPATPGDAVIYLLTSGSTGAPKCVAHTHATVLARTRAAALANGFGAGDVTVNWMPLDHVSIVMYNARDVVLRCEHVNARAYDFLGEPTAWLDWIDRYRGTNTWAPNFAFALVNTRLADGVPRRWDLSCLRNVCNAAEMISPRTARRFLELLEPYGLRPDAMVACWGMSETCSGVTYSRLTRATGVLTAARDSLDGDVEVADAGDPDAIDLAEDGAPVPGFELRVVDEAGRVVPELRVGSLEVRGEMLFREYVNDPAATRAAFTADGWFRTGDRACIHRGRLVVTGRGDDLVVVRGVNVARHEVEAVAGQVDGVDPGWVAACSARVESGGAKGLVVFFVPPSSRPAERLRVAAAIRASVARDLGLEVDLVVPVPRHRFPRTESGKVQARKLVAELEAGRLRPVSAGADPGPPSWFFERVWQPVSAPRRAMPPVGAWLLLAHDGLPELRELAGGGRRLVVARGGRRFERDGDGFRVRPDSVQDHRSLLAAVRVRHGDVTCVLHAWSVSADARALRGLRSSAYSLLALLRALGRDGAPPPVLVLATRSVCAGEGDELDPPKATLAGLVRTAAAERAVPRIALVDLDPHDPRDWPRVVSLEAAPVADAHEVVAWRDGRRLAPRLRPLPRAPAATAPIEPGGLWLLTGGLGGIGSHLARHLLTAYSARIAIVGRSESRSPAVRTRLAALRELGEVVYTAADVADSEALAPVLAAAETRWRRPLAGVLHLAGADVSGHWRELEVHALTREHRAAFDAQYGAKVFGTLALARLLEQRPDALLVLFSSVNGHFGGSSFGAYASASSFLDGFAEFCSRARGRRVRSLAWSMWSGVGVNRETPAALAAAHRGFRGISPAQGIASFERALAYERPLVLIGLDGRVLERPRPTSARTRDGAHEPQAPLERAIADIWEQVLRAPSASRNDTFFELGGSSLQAAQAVAAIGRLLATAIPVRVLYENPTIASLAAALEEAAA